MFAMISLLSWTYSLACLLVRFVVGLPVMSSLIRRISRRIGLGNNVRGSAHPQLIGDVADSVDEFIEVAKVLVTHSNVDGIMDALKNKDGVGIDDRKMLLESLIQYMSTLKDTEFSIKMQRFFLELLYKDLPHPPNNFLAVYPLNATLEEIPQRQIKYAYRTADGSYNNPLLPALGKAGTPYARSVSTTNIAPKAALPDPGLVFDTLLKRDKFVEHPGGISSLFFAFADLVIHSVFNTRQGDWSINDASSYLDLSILYGSNQQEQDSVRRKDGSGKLYEDAFADKRLLNMPHATCALLVLLSRNHNFIAQRILEINENGNFVDPSKLEGEDKTFQEDELFHRSRLVNCGYFMKIILGDYVGAILGLVESGSDWRLDPLMTMRSQDHEFCPVGQGNVVSIEFNLLYRWHATFSMRDEAWATNFFEKMFPGKDPSKITPDDFKKAAMKRMAEKRPPTDWEFGDLKRDKVTKRFKDEDLAKILQDATESRASAFKAQGIPQCMRIVEILGIMQSRSWGACSLNEFRKFLGLKPYRRFEDWNHDPNIHTAAKKLYRDIDNLELHVGLQAEDPKKHGPGAGLCPGYTISRAILADAVALSRGDRFLTTEFNPYNLTKWGYQDCQYDPQDGSYGGMLTKLLFRTLPDYYHSGSTYAHFPFLDPVFMEAHMEKENPVQAAKYVWTRPKRSPPTDAIEDIADVQRVLSNPSTFASSYKKHKFTVVRPALGKADISPSMKRNEKKKRYSLFASNSDKEKGNSAEDGKKAKVDRRSYIINMKAEDKDFKDIDDTQKKLEAGAAGISKEVFLKPRPEDGTYFSQTTRSLIKEKSFVEVDAAISHVDIVKDVVNLVPVHWISYILGLPLKTESNIDGDWPEESVCAELADVAHYVYLNFEPGNEWKLRESAQATADKFIGFIESHINTMNPKAVVNDIVNHLSINGYHSHDYLHKLWQSCGKTGHDSYREFATEIFASIVPTAALYSHCVAQIVDFYLEEDNQAARDELLRLLNSDDKAASSTALARVHEALKRKPPVSGVLRNVGQDFPLSSMEAKAGAHVFAKIANPNQEVLSGADTFDYLQAAFAEDGTAGFLTSEFFEHTVLPTLRVILGLKGLKRALGQSGRFTVFKEKTCGSQATHYIDIRGLITPFADSLVVQYES